MYTRNKLLLISLLVFTAFFFGGCSLFPQTSKNPEGNVNKTANTNDYVGTWLRQSIFTGAETLPGGSATLVFTDKNTFLSMSDAGVSEGTIKIDKDKLTMTITGGLGAGTTVDQQYQITDKGQTLTITYKNSGLTMKEVYKRKE